MTSHLWALALACVHAVAAHWQLATFLAILTLSVANKLLPGHPRFSGFARLLVSLLAASPMAGARSAAFLFIASKLGDGAAAAFVHWLSTWLDIPVLSISVTAPGGQPRLYGGGRSALAFAMALVLAGTSTGCGLFKSSLGSDEAKCADAAVAAIRQRVAALLLAGGPDYLAQLEAIGTQVGFATLICAIQVAIADFQGLQAGVAPATGLAAGRDYSVAIARGRAAVDRFGPH